MSKPPEPGTTLRLMSPSGRTSLEMLFEEGRDTPRIYGDVKAAMPTFLAAAAYLWLRSRGLCEDLTEEVIIERMTEATRAAEPTTEANQEIGDPGSARPFCVACHGQGGRFDGDPTRGQEGWIVCNICGGHKS
jgi:hypothetical protein